MKKVNKLYVYYGANEYTSHITNDAMARQYATRPEYKDQWPLLVETVEHGGWAMTHYFDAENPNGIVVGTANDAARWHPNQAALREELYNAERNIIGEVRRPKREEVGPAISSARFGNEPYQHEV